MGDNKNEDPIIKQIFALGAPYPMVVLPIEGEYWMEGNIQLLSRDTNKRPVFPSVDMSRCTFDEDENVYNYRRNFAGKEHVNYAGEDMRHGPMLMSVLLDLSVDDDVCDHYIVMLRMRHKTILKVIPCNSLANDVPGPRDFMRYILGEEPEVDRFHPIALPRASDDVTRFDEHTATTCHKVGVLYQTFGQIREEDYLQNQDISPAFEEFMELIGEKVKLKDFTNYRGGLDVRFGQTGEYSYYTNYKNREIMFHASPVLPYTPNDSQQLSRKRHIGNDVVSIIFQEENTPFCPGSIRSHVLHVFIVIQVEKSNTTDTYYKMSVTAKEGVPKFAPSLPNPCIFKKGPEFRNFLLTKVINGEAAALKCEKFSALGDRTRSSLLEQMVNELITKNERLLENGPCIDDTDSPQKSNSFLSTFRSAWHKNGRTGSSNNSIPNDTLKNTKNLGQSLSLNDLTLLSLEVEDGKKDIKISSKEKKKKKKSGNLHNNTIPMLKSQVLTTSALATQVLGNGNNVNTLNDSSPPMRPRSAHIINGHDLKTASELSPGIRQRSVFHVDQTMKAKSTSFLDQCSVPKQTSSLPRNASLSTPTSTRDRSTPSTQNGYDSPELVSGRGRGESGVVENIEHSLELASASAEIDRLKAEVNKLQLDKMDLIRQNVIHQREVKKLNERHHSLLNKKEKRKSAFVVTSTEFV